MSDRLTNISLDVLECIIEEIYAKIKADILARANLYIEKIRALLQIAVNKKYMSIGQYEHVSSSQGKLRNI